MPLCTQSTMQVSCSLVPRLTRKFPAIYFSTITLARVERMGTSRTERSAIYFWAIERMRALNARRYAHTIPEAHTVL